MSRVGRLGRQRDLLVAALRAVLQLAFVAAALRGVFAAPLTSVAVVAVMFSVATWTAARRLRGSRRARCAAVLLSCGAGAAVVIAIIVALPTLDRNVRTFVAVSGIVLGGTMTGGDAGRPAPERGAAPAPGRGRGLAVDRRDAARGGPRRGPVRRRPRRWCRRWTRPGRSGW